MKKFLSLGVIAAAMVTLSSCNTDGGETTQVLTIPTFNVVTDMAANTTDVSMGIYTVDVNFTQGTIALATKDLVIDSTTHGFSFDATKYSVERYSTEISLVDFFQIKNPAIMQGTSSSALVTNSTFNVVNRIYLYNNTQAGNPGIVAQYNVGNEWLVRTLPPTMWYLGTTTTSVEGMDQPYSSDKIVYIITFDRTGKKANVQIPNAKFNEKMPSLNLLLKDVDVTWSMQGFSLSGKDLACHVVNGNSTTPNDDYKFAKFDFSSTSQNMLNASSAFQVVMTKEEHTATYKGQFIGSANPNTKKD